MPFQLFEPNDELGKRIRHRALERFVKCGNNKGIFLCFPRRVNFAQMLRPFPTSRKRQIRDVQQTLRRVLAKINCRRAKGLQRVISCRSAPRSRTGRQICMPSVAGEYGFFVHEAKLIPPGIFDIERPLAPGRVTIVSRVFFSSLQPPGSSVEKPRDAIGGLLQCQARAAAFLFRL